MAIRERESAEKKKTNTEVKVQEKASLWTTDTRREGSERGREAKNGNSTAWDFEEFEGGQKKKREDENVKEYSVRQRKMAILDRKGMKNKRKHKEQ